MFLRPHFRTVDGQRRAYWALVESIRTERGPRQRVVAYLGVLDEVGRLGVRQAAGPHSGGDSQASLFEGDATQPRYVSVDVSKVRVENCREFGGPWLSWQLIRRLGLDEFLERAIPRGDEQIRWGVMSLVLVIALTVLSGIPDAEDGQDFYTLLLGATVGMMLAVSANHLLMVFVAVEMMSVPSYAMVGFLKGRRLSSEASLKFIVYGAGAAGVMLYGISLLVDGVRYARRHVGIAPVLVLALLFFALLFLLLAIAGVSSGIVTAIDYILLVIQVVTGAISDSLNSHRRERAELVHQGELQLGTRREVLVEDEVEPAGGDIASFSLAGLGDAGGGRADLHGQREVVAAALAAVGHGGFVHGARGAGDTGRGAGQTILVVPGRGDGRRVPGELRVVAGAAAKRGRRGLGPRGGGPVGVVYGLREAGARQRLLSHPGGAADCGGHAGSDRAGLGSGDGGVAGSGIIGDDGAGARSGGAPGLLSWIAAHQGVARGARGAEFSGDGGVAQLGVSGDSRQRRAGCGVRRAVGSHLPPGEEQAMTALRRLIADPNGGASP